MVSTKENVNKSIPFQHSPKVLRDVCGRNQSLYEACGRRSVKGENGFISYDELYDAAHHVW